MTATPQLIHAGIELVVASAVTFWLNRKISRLSHRVTLLDEKVKYYEQIVNQHHALLKKLCQPGPPAAPTESRDLPRKTTASLSTPLADLGAPRGHDSVGSTVEPPTVIELQAPSRDDDNDSTNLDHILAEEISDLKAQTPVSLS